MTKQLHELTKEELIQIVQDYQETVSDKCHSQNIVQKDLKVLDIS